MRGSPDGAPGNFGSELAPFPAGTADITVNDAGNLSASNTRITGLLSWLQGASQPRILVDPIDPANIYVISADDPDNQYTNTTDWSNIVMTTSHDFGVTWGAPETISHDPGTAIQIMPAAAIDQQGNIAVTWYDTRNQIAGTNSIGKDGIPGTSDDGDLLLDVYATFGSRNADGSHTFLPNDFRLSDVSFDPEPFTVDRFPGSNVLRIGEYNGLAASNGEAFAVWTGNSYVDNSPSFPTVGGQRLIFDTFAMGVVSKIDGLSSKATLGFTTDQAPALASNNGFMYLAFRGETDDHLYLARKNPDAPADSTDWGGAFDTNQTTDAAPALVSVDGNLFLAWTGTDNHVNVAKVGDNGGGTFTLTPEGEGSDFATGYTSDVGPALGALNGALYLAAYWYWYRRCLPRLQADRPGLPGSTIGGVLVSPASKSDWGPAFDATQRLPTRLPHWLR